MATVRCPRCWGTGYEPAATTLSVRACRLCRGLRWVTVIR